MAMDNKEAYWIGCLSGFSVAAGLVLSWFAFNFSDLRATYDGFGGELPAITKLVTNQLYLRAMPVVVLAVVILGNIWVKKPRLLLTLVAVTSVVALSAVVVGYCGATLPMRELAGNISAG
jgi:hypothetical protein